MKNVNLGLKNPPGCKTKQVTGLELPKSIDVAIRLNALKHLNENYVFIER